MKRAFWSLAAWCVLSSCGAEPRLLEVDPPPPGTVLWVHQGDSQLWAPLALEDGALYFGDDSGAFQALSTTTREVLWRFATGGRIRSAAAVAAGTAVFASDDGFLYALDRETGEERWRFDLGSAAIERRLPDTGPPYDYDYRHSSPIVENGVVYIGSADASLYAVDLVTGRRRWRFPTGASVRSTPRVFGGSVYFGSWDGHVYSIDAQTGEESWRFDTGGRVQGSPAVAGGRVIVGSRSGKIVALDAASGEPVWIYEHEDGSWVESSPVVRGEIVYVGSSDALGLFVLDAASGREIWEFETGGWSWGSPVVTEDTVYIGSVSASPYYFEGVDLVAGFYAVDRETGRERWRMTPEAIEGYVTGGVFPAPQIEAGVVYVAGLDGRVYALAE